MKYYHTYYRELNKAQLNSIWRIEYGFCLEKQIIKRKPKKVKQTYYRRLQTLINWEKQFIPCHRVIENSLLNVKKIHQETNQDWIGDYPFVSWGIITELERQKLIFESSLIEKV